MPQFSTPPGNEFTNRRAVPEIKVVHYKFSDVSNSPFTLSIPIEPGTYVTGVGHEVNVAFSGGTPTLVIGDGTTANLFGTTAEFVPQTINTFAMKRVCKKYKTLGAVVLTHVTGLTAGEGTVFIEYFKTAGDWRLPAL